jgi:MPBQ/MSBQ methyltransferase
MVRAFFINFSSFLDVVQPYLKAPCRGGENAHLVSKSAFRGIHTPPQGIERPPGIPKRLEAGMPGYSRTEDEIMIDPELERNVRAHLAEQYAGIFPPSQIHKHFDEYVGMNAASDLYDYMQDCVPLKKGARILDIGCGFGSFVLLARKRGLDAQGVDVADFDLDFARKRFEAENPGENPAPLYRNMDARRMEFPDATFDAVTFWNVLEHIPGTASVLAEAARVLKPGGTCFILAPNYLAFRKEAHYQVPWMPLFPRKLANAYLRGLGRSPSFLNDCIFYVTEPGVKRILRKTGFRIAYDSLPTIQKLDQIDRIKPGMKKSLMILARKTGLILGVRLFLAAKYRNPLKTSINIIAKKPAMPAA